MRSIFSENPTSLSAWMQSRLAMDVNPFESVIVSEPRRIERPVAGLNEGPLQGLTGQLEKLAAGDFPRAIKLPGAQFVQSPAPGYGKSHLIGRLFKRLRGRATLIYLRPYTNAATSWKSILLKMVQELEFPESAEAEFCSEHEANQLESLIHGTLVNVAINGINGGAIRVKDKQASVNNFQRATLEHLRSNEKWVEWVFDKRAKLAELMERQLKQRGIFLNASPLSWMSVLVHYAYRPKAYELRQACLDWLRGGSIDDGEAGQIGVLPADRPVHDPAMDQVNATGKDRIIDFCGLAGFYRPFVFCFDQTENYGSDPVMAKSLGVVIQGLVDDCLNHMTVVTANQAPWSKVVQPHWEHAHRDRLCRPALELRGLDKDQARELVKTRMEGWEPLPEKAAAMLETGWLDELFSKSKELGVRHFLLECSRRWLGPEPAARPKPGKKTPPATINGLYQAFVNKIKSQPKRLVFDPDALYWLVQEVACRQGAAFKKFKSERGYLAARWDVDGRKIYFGFEAGHHFKRWQAIQKEAARCHAAEASSKVVFFRTPELRVVPGPGWKIAPEIADAKKRYLHVILLSRDDMAELYGAYDLYMGAVEGDIPVQPADAVGFVRERLKHVWERVLEPEPRNWGGDEGGAAPPPPGVEPKSGLIHRIREIVRREKFMSVADLMARISPPVSEEELHKARACIAEIQVHTSPTMTVLQWRPNR